MLYNNSNIVKIHRYFDCFLNNMTTITGIQWLIKSLDLIEDNLWNENDHAEKKRLMNILETYIDRFLNRCKEVCNIPNYDPDSIKRLKESIELIRSYENAFKSKLKSLKPKIDETYNAIIDVILEEDPSILVNQIIKNYFKLSEEKKSEALPLLKRLGINPYSFKNREKRKEDKQNRGVFSDKSNVYEYRISGAVAKMIIRNGSFIILKGSTAVKENKPSMPESSRNKKMELISLREIILDKKSDLYIFTENIPFNSPSMASAVISGMSTNGRLCFNIPIAK